MYLQYTRTNTQITLTYTYSPSSDVKYSHVLVMTADYPNSTPPNRPQLQHAAAPNATSKPHSNQESTPTPPRRVALDKPWGLWFFEHAYRVAARLESLDAHHQAFADQQDRSAQDLHTSEGSSVRAHGGGRGKGDSVHVAEVSEITEMAETASYLFRYDYGAFWMARPMRCMSPHTKLSLPLLGLFLASSPYLRWCLGVCCDCFCLCLCLCLCINSSVRPGTLTSLRTRSR